MRASLPEEPTYNSSTRVQHSAAFSRRGIRSTPRTAPVFPLPPTRQTKPILGDAPTPGDNLISGFHETLLRYRMGNPRFRNWDEMIFCGISYNRRGFVGLEGRGYGSGDIWLSLVVYFFSPLGHRSLCTPFPLWRPPQMPLPPPPPLLSKTLTPALGSRIGDLTSPL